MISCGARLAPFDIPQLREIMSYDELELDKLGMKNQRCSFLSATRTPPTTFWLPSLFRRCSTFCVNGLTTLWRASALSCAGAVGRGCQHRAGAGLEKIVAVIRSREISLTLFYQAMSQCKHCTKTIPKPSWATWTVSYSSEAGGFHPKGYFGKLAGQGHHLYADRGPKPWTV